MTANVVSADVMNIVGWDVKSELDICVKILPSPMANAVSFIIIKWREDRDIAQCELDIWVKILHLSLTANAVSLDIIKWQEGTSKVSRISE